MPLIAYPIFLLAASVVAVYLARRGRRIDDHPLCRKCGFDLTGKPDDSSRCAECGADIHRRNAIRIGHRSPAKRWLAAAYSFTLLAIGWLGLIGYATFNSAEFQRMKPIWWLMRDVRASDVATRDGAVGELLWRAENDRLSDDAIPEVVAAGLKHQGDLSQSWLPTWGGVIEQLHTKGRLRDADWVTYVQQAVAPAIELHARPYVRRGDLEYFEVHTRNPRCLAASLFVDAVPATPTTIGGVAVPEAIRLKIRPQRWALGGVVGRRSYRAISEFTDHWQGLNDGPQTCVIDTEIAIYDAPGKSAPIAKRLLHLTAPIDIQPATASPFKMRTDPDLRPTMLAAVGVQKVTLDRGEWHVDLNCSPQPVPMLMDVTLRSGGVEVGKSSRELYRLWDYKAAKVESLRLKLCGELADLPKKVDIVLSPSRERRPGCGNLIGEIWGEPIVIRDVPVQGN